MKVLGGYAETSDAGVKARQESLGRDHLWLRRRGTLADSVKTRLARFHLVDNTRGEPPFWREDEVQRLELTLDQGRLTGSVRLETKAGDRGYDARLLGVPDRQMVWKRL